MPKKLIIIDNESIFTKDDIFYCDNIEAKSISEGLNKNFEVFLFARKSKIQRSHKINLKKINISSNIFGFLLNIFKTIKNKETKYLLISISPYTFLSGVFLFFFRKKVYVYLRSDGYKEYKKILSFVGPIIFHSMFTIISWKANLISCNSNILKGKKGKIVSPSQLTETWFSPHQNANLKNISLLYVGRLKVEKGIFSLLKILPTLKVDAKLSVVPVETNYRNEKKQKNVEYIKFKNDNGSIKEIYDSHNIFILPSFTEGHPQVLDESLSRLRPVIIFEEISHIIGNRKGIFISKRDSESLSNTITYIMNNYGSIQDSIRKNILPTKENFLKQMLLIINES